MRIVASALFLTFAVLFNLIELISSNPVTFKGLFPGYNGILPRITDFPPQNIRHLNNFFYLNDRRLVYENVTFLARDHVIVGWKDGDLIKAPCTLFLLEDIPVVYKMNTEEWLTVQDGLTLQDDWQKLGIGRLLPLVRARDRIAGMHRLTSNTEKAKQAHYVACEQANLEADIIENQQVINLNSNRTTLEESIAAIDNRYSHVYIDVYNRYIVGKVGSTSTWHGRGHPFSYP